MTSQDEELNPNEEHPPLPPSYQPLLDSAKKGEALSPFQRINNLVLRDETSRMIKKIAELENDLDDLQDEKRRRERGIFLKLLPIMDSLDSILRLVRSDNELITSLESLRSQFIGMLEDQEVITIPLEIGQKLDVTLCDISRQQPREDLEPELIIQIDRRGYYLQSKVLRKARVVISILP